MLAEGIICQNILHVLTVKLMLFKHCTNDPQVDVAPLCKKTGKTAIKKPW
jgi:hypothetical protein